MVCGPKAALRDGSNNESNYVFVRYFHGVNDMASIMNQNENERKDLILSRHPKCLNSFVLQKRILNDLK